MMNQTSALIAINLPVLLNNQNLPQILRRLGVHIKNKSPINTKESFLTELEYSKPTFALVYTGLAGVISLSEVISKSKQLSPTTKTILIVNENDNLNIQNFFSSSVDGIIHLENLSATLEFALRQLSKGETFICGKSLKWLKSNINSKTTNEKRDHGLLQLLTTRELEVLNSLTRGINYKQISKDLFISESTVKTHVNNIFTKLNVNDRTQAVLYALHHGITNLTKRSHTLSDILNDPVQNT